MLAAFVCATAAAQVRLLTQILSRHGDGHLLACPWRCSHEYGYRLEWRTYSGKGSNCNLQSFQMRGLSISWFERVLVSRTHMELQLKRVAGHADCKDNAT
jgi:hypothetical protein